ncbi:hypothetical protein L195_g000702 [Trifolium pratense]|uniref:Uncharacterized protein n=1 Tax=Trifolium pratense TaxID=57577 RepID=A0A2K3NMM4_TRIPR|nr:hypothetical protein L195_g000702 [Trifolium pratense]
MSNLDLNVWENGIMGIGERNIIQGLMMPDKFTLPGMDCTFDLKSSCLAKQKDKPLEKESLSHEFVTRHETCIPQGISHGYELYSLAVTSNLIGYLYHDIACGKVKHKSLFDEMDYMSKSIVAVDSCQFTTEEMWVLIEMCDMYPKRRFGQANIYNNLILAKDDLVIFTDEENVDFVSPPHMCGNPKRL